MSLLPRAVPPDSPNSRQHRNSLANAINGVIKMLGSFVMANVTDYATGSWTPVDTSGASLTLTGVTAGYTKIGNMVFAYARFIYPSTSNGSAAQIGGLPFSTKNDEHARQGMLTYTSNSLISQVVPDANAKTFTFFGPAGGQATNANMSGTLVYVQLIYPIA